MIPKEERKSDFIFRQPKPNERIKQKGRGGDDYDADKHREMVEEIERRDLDTKLASTISSASGKRIRDKDSLYFVLELDEKTSDNKIL